MDLISLTTSSSRLGSSVVFRARFPDSSISVDIEVLGGGAVSSTAIGSGFEDETGKLLSLFGEVPEFTVGT